MPEVTELTILRIARAGSVAELVPSRGGVVTRLASPEREVLYLDEATLRDPAKNLRGGIPVLFPAPGKLEGGRFLHRGASYEMNQHGFARELPWTVVAAAPDALTLTLSSSEETKRRFPFDFRLTFTYTLEPAPEGAVSLSIRQRYENLSAEAMPLHAGFHPYFLVPDAEKTVATIDARATRAFDNVTKTERAFDGFDLTLPEVDVHLLDQAGPSMTLARAHGRGKVTVSGSPEFTQWVVWTLAGKDFVCVEPWTAPGNALNTGERLMSLEPGAARELLMTIDAT